MHKTFVLVVEGLVVCRILALCLATGSEVGLPWP